MAHQSLLSVAHIGLQGPYLSLDIGDLLRKLDQLRVKLLYRESFSKETFDNLPTIFFMLVFYLRYED